MFIIIMALIQALEDYKRSYFTLIHYICLYSAYSMIISAVTLHQFSIYVYIALIGRLLALLLYKSLHDVVLF